MNHNDEYDPTTNRLAQLRHIYDGMTQDEMARSLSIAFSTYRNFEKGYREMKSDLLIKICEKYGCSIDWLLGLGDPDDWKLR